MAKPSSFRFVIADNKPRSECWSVFIKENDVYLTGSAYKRTLKASLHGSGVCQVALLEGFFEEHVAWRADRPESRSILRWKRLPVTEGRGLVAASILFASYEFWPEQDAMPASKPYTSLAPPPNMHGRMVHVIFSRDDPIHVAQLGGWMCDLLFSTQLPNKEFVCLQQQLEPLPEGFFDFTPLSSKYFLTLGIKDSEMGDVRGISFFDCEQLYEGHCCIRSLHNMRLTKIPAEDD